jgi:glycosyltransferase involved in cell wall biosynthesis
MPKLIRITTAPISLNVLLPGQMKYMREQGMDVLMVSSDGPELKAVLEREGCRHHIVPMTRKMSPFADLRCLWLLYRLFRKEKPDMVHSHTPKAGLLAMLAAKFAGVKFRLHTVAGLRYVTTKGMSRRILIAMEKLTGMAATHVWPNSASMMEYIKAHKLVSPRKLEVIGWGSSNGVNLQRYNPAVLRDDKLREIKSLVQYDPALFYFLSVGRLVHDKGLDELTGAFIKVYEQHPHTRLILVGAFEDEVDPVSEKTRELIKTHPGIIAAGWSDAVEYFMHIAQVLVHPSHREGFPNVLMQAGAMGCPIICSAIDGNTDIVKPGETGLLFEVMNETALFDQLQKAINDPAAMKAMAGQLLQNIQTHYDQRVVQQFLHQKYQQLLAGR